ncbi:MAG: hypothetical protein AAF327_23765 [Cyanobacteria bacterium P01_A01_bin.37]
MSKLSQILSQTAARLDAIEDRVSGAVDAVLDQTALNSPMAKSKIPKASEVTLFGYFVWDPEVTGQEEIDILLSADPLVNWSPSVWDFMAVTGLSATYAMGNFEALLAAISDYKPNSISRLNFFTHGNSITLGIAGTIDSSNVFFDASINESKLDFYAQEGLTIIDESKGKEREISLEDVRKRFKEDAIFVLYSCNSGASRGLLESLSKLLQITVIGFNESILYCPPVQNNPPFRRKGMKISISKNPGGCSKNAKVGDWRSLINDESAIRISTQKPKVLDAPVE